MLKEGILNFANPLGEGDSGVDTEKDNDGSIEALEPQIVAGNQENNFPYTCYITKDLSYSS